MIFILHNSVYAQRWIYVGVTGLSTGEKDIYISQEKITQKMNISILPLLLNFKHQQFLPEGTFFSEKQNWEFNCEKREMRHINSEIYNKRMGQGKLIKKIDYSSKDWTEIITGTVNESKWIVACNKFKNNNL